MERILFVTGSPGGVGVGDLQHQDDLRKSNAGFRQYARHNFEKVCGGDRGNHVEELRLFPAQDTI
jgi:ethanolamine utilization protein EutQ (cupin superfamily)